MEMDYVGYSDIFRVDSLVLQEKTWFIWKNRQINWILKTEKKREQTDSPSKQNVIFKIKSKFSG